MFEKTLTKAPVPFVDECGPMPASSTPTQDAEFLAWLWASERGYDEPGEATEVVEQSIGALGGTALASYLASLPPLAGVDGWTVVEAIKGYEKLERYASAMKLRAIAELAARHPDPRDPLSARQGTRSPFRSCKGCVLGCPQGHPHRACG